VSSLSLLSLISLITLRWMDWESKLAYYDRTYGELMNEW
jgi:hypothetical protein